MNNSDSHFTDHTNKRLRFNNFPSSSLLPRKKFRPTVSTTASLDIKTFGLPLISTATGSSCESIRLEPYRHYTIGRNKRRCEFTFDDRRVSKRHCYFSLDPLSRKIYIADGVYLLSSDKCSRVRVSLNGVYVNGVRLGRGEAVELFAGTEVSLVCGNEGVCSFGSRIGFVVERVAFVEEVVNRSVSSFRASVKDSGFAIDGLECGGLMATTELLLSRCSQILSSDDPILYIRECLNSYGDMRVRSVCRNRVSNNFALSRSNVFKLPVSRELELEYIARSCREELCRGERLATDVNSETKSAVMGQLNSVISNKKTLVSEVNSDPECCNVTSDNLKQIDNDGVPLENGISTDKAAALSLCIGEENVPQSDKVLREENRGVCVLPPGKKFYLNRLHFMGHGSSEHGTVSLPELLYPVESLVRIFIATFTSDILWFLAYCEIPAHLPVTIACHNAERCWSSSLDERTSVPYSDFPHVVVVYPPFPEVIAFGKDRKKLGIACHHPKLFVLQREDSIRVIITSANLVPKQWHVVSNTVWWQDFPLASAPDYSSLFTQSSVGEINQDSKPDFAAQLAGFMSSLVADVPSQAHWILQLTKYDFKGAVGHLVASIPGVHSPKAPYISESKHVLTIPKGRS